MYGVMWLGKPSRWHHSQHLTATFTVTSTVPKSHSRQIMQYINVFRLKVWLISAIHSPLFPLFLSFWPLICSIPILKRIYKVGPCTCMYSCSRRYAPQTSYPRSQNVVLRGAYEAGGQLNIMYSTSPNDSRYVPLGYLGQFPIHLPHHIEGHCHH